jgi:Zn-dependent M28 family amino/carboxypeptidase
MTRTCLLACLAAAASAQSFKAPHPTVQKVVEQVSADRIAAIMKKLESYGTRDIHAPQNPQARDWIAAELRSYSPRLVVTLDSHNVPKKGRVQRDLEVVNVVATLKGKTQPDVQVLIMGHYDTIALIRKPGATPPQMDWEKTSPNPKAPGVSDNASGVAALMELARVMSQFEFDKTIVFLATSGEEYGLHGATGYAANARKNTMKIEAILNNDIIGNDDNGQGLRVSNQVNLFSDDPADSPSRSLARYVRDAAERYVPSMRVNVVFRADRFGRGGDHTPFNAQGFGGVRFTTAAEDLKRQHTAEDRFEFASAVYCADVTRVNGAALASLALAPRPPIVTRDASGSEAQSGYTQQVNLARGPASTDAVLKWKSNDSEARLAGYAILMRSTSAPFWEREIFVGKVTEYTLKNVLIDDIVLGVKAISAEGVESMVSAYILPRRNFAGI